MNIDPAAVDVIAGRRRARITRRNVTASREGSQSPNDDHAAINIAIETDPAAAAVAAAGVSQVAPLLPPPAFDIPIAGRNSIVHDNLIVQGMNIEGLHDVSDVIRRHATTFYDNLIPLADGAGDSYKLIGHGKYSRILEALLLIRDGEKLSVLRKEYPQIHKWNKAFGVIHGGNNTHILIARPSGALGEEIDADTVKRVTYIERVFADLLLAHGEDHNKGRTLYSRMMETVNNCPRPVCKLFTDTCPHCIEHRDRNRPVAGLRPIITRGFNVRGQVDLVDFQSMPDGEFRFLLNYIDHGIKFLFSIPIVRKRASCIALALFQIFTIIGPPMILQSDNGSEFHRAAMNARYEKNGYILHWCYDLTVCLLFGTGSVMTGVQVY